MNWNSAAEFFAMGGYGLYVWGAYARDARLHGGRAGAGRAAPSRARAARCAEADAAMKPRHKRLAHRRRHRLRRRRRRRAGAERVPEQPRVLLFAVAGGGATKRRARAPSASAAWSRRAACKRDGTTVRFVVTDTAQVDPRASTTASCPTCSRKARASSRRASSARTACSSPREVLAKHDENYMPPEAAEALKQRAARQPEAGRVDARRADPQMIPELGQFALLLALGVGARARRAADARRGARPRRLDGAGAARGARASSCSSRSPSAAWR